MATRGRSHRRRRPDRLRDPVPHRLRPAARPRRARSSCDLLEIPDAVKAAEGTALELFDCAFPLLSDIDISDDAKQGLRRRQRRAADRRPPALEGHGARRPARGQRRDLQAAGRGAQQPAPPTTCAILVVGNPANTNALIAMSNAPDIPAERFTRDDAAGREPRGRAARPEARASASTTSRTSWCGATTRRRCSPTSSTRRSTGRARRRPGRHGLVRERVHPARRQARRRDHRGARRVVGRVGRQRGGRPHARLGRRAPTGCARWPSAHGGQYGVEEGLMSLVPAALQRRRLRDRRGPRGRRLRAGEDRRDGERAQGGARRREAAGPCLTDKRF